MGGLSIKIVPYWAGLPDRLILLPGGRMFLIETKAPGGRLRPVQRVWHEKAAARGTQVLVLSTLEEVDVWLHQQEGNAE